MSVAEWRRESGLSKSTIYRHLAQGAYCAKKAGRRTLIDTESAYGWLRSLPDFRPSNQMSGAERGGPKEGRS